MSILSIDTFIHEDISNPRRGIIFIPHNPFIKQCIISFVQVTYLRPVFQYIRNYTITFSNTTKKGVISLTRYAKIHNEQAVNPLCMSI